MATLAVSANAQEVYGHSDPFGAIDGYNELGARINNLAFENTPLALNTYSDISVVGDVLYALNTATSQIESFDAAGNAVTAAFTGVFLNNNGTNTSPGPLYTGLSIVGDVAYGLFASGGNVDAFDATGARVDATSAFGDVNVAPDVYEGISVFRDTIYFLNADTGAIDAFQVDTTAPGNAVAVTDSVFANTFLNNTGDNTPSAIYNGLSVQSIPEPSSTALLGLGALALIVRRKR